MDEKIAAQREQGPLLIGVTTGITLSSYPVEATQPPSLFGVQHCMIYYKRTGKEWFKGFQQTGMINAGGDGNANCSDLIIIHCLHALNYHPILHKYVKYVVRVSDKHKTHGSRNSEGISRQTLGQDRTQTLLRFKSGVGNPLNFLELLSRVIIS